MSHTYITTSSGNCMDSRTGIVTAISKSPQVKYWVKDSSVKGGGYYRTRPNTEQQHYLLGQKMLAGGLAGNILAKHTILALGSTRMGKGMDGVANIILGLAAGPTVGMGAGYISGRLTAPQTRTQYQRQKKLVGAANLGLLGATLASHFIAKKQVSRIGAFERMKQRIHEEYVKGGGKFINHTPMLSAPLNVLEG